MGKKAARRTRRLKDTSAQKAKKKKRQHFAYTAPTIPHHTSIKDMWDDHLTLRQNYAKLGTPFSVFSTTRYMLI